MDQAGGSDTYGFVADYYDHVVPYRERQDVDFYVQMARAFGEPVLEVGCGTGRILLPTARAGIEIVGLDLSASMMGVCRRRLQAEPAEVRSRVQLLEADMRDFHLGRRFALATIPFRAFQHLIEVEEQMSCLQALHRHLEPKGRLILDLFNPSIPILANTPAGEPFGSEPAFAMADGRSVIRSSRFVSKDLHAQVSHIELIYEITHPDARTERLVHAFPMRYLYRYEAEHLLARCGFTVEALYADHDRSPYGSKYPGELIFVARKA